MEVLQTANLEMVPSLKQILASTFKQVVQAMEGLMFLRRRLFFDEPHLKGVFSSIVITHFGIIGRGVKWSIPILVLTHKISKAASPH